ncbi:MAG: RNA pseudouridine synthase [Pirellula sp.]|nr:RNA pseudouridine synthase [Pirellula sp.]
MTATFVTVYQDDRLLVLDKPSGLLAVPGRGPDLQDCLSARVQQAYPSALVVHRLDRDTSGLLVMALTPEVQRQLNRQFATRSVRKRYAAVVAGNIAADAGLVDLALRKDFDHPPRHMVDPELGKPAQTRWRVIGRSSDRTRVELEPITGRSHQLRIHLASLGHPILGDPLYASPEVAAMAPRLLLHAERLAFTYPDEDARDPRVDCGRTVEFTAECPF